MRLLAPPKIQLPELRAEDLKLVLEAMGQKTVELIVKRTNAGRDAQLQPFHVYSPAYAARRRGMAIYNGQVMSRRKAFKAHAEDSLKAGAVQKNPRRLVGGTPRLRVTGKMLGNLKVIEADGQRVLVGWTDTSLWPIVRGLTITWRGKHKPPGPGRRFFALEHESDLVQVRRIAADGVYKLLTRGLR